MNMIMNSVQITQWVIYLTCIGLEFVPMMVNDYAVAFSTIETMFSKYFIAIAGDIIFWCSLIISVIIKYSAHMQSVTPSIIARLCYTFSEVTFFKNEGSCATSHMWRHECHPSWVSSLKTSKKFPPVNFLCLFLIIL